MKFSKGISTKSVYNVYDKTSMIYILIRHQISNHNLVFLQFIYLSQFMSQFHYFSSTKLRLLLNGFPIIQIMHKHFKLSFHRYFVRRKPSNGTHVNRGYTSTTISILRKFRPWDQHPCIILGLSHKILWPT